MSYLKKYGSKRKFQGGGPMPADPAMAPAPAGPEAGGGGGGGEEQIVALAQGAVAGDQAAAAELGMMLAPMILQEVQAGGGGGAAPAQADPAAQPVFRKGGAFIGKN
jgi:hypothetical protein